MTREELAAAIVAAGSEEAFVDNEVLERTPWIFSGDTPAFNTWRSSVARDLKSRARDVFLVGSAATGYSLSPSTAGRPFRPLVTTTSSASDIDLALVSPGLFEEAWQLLVRLERRNSLTITADEKPRMRVGIYWGRLEQRAIPLGTSPARRLAAAVAAVARREPTVGYSVSIRVYRVFGDLRGYQTHSLRTLRESLSAGGAS